MTRVKEVLNSGDSRIKKWGATARPRKE